MKKYLLIEVFNREITTNTFNTLEEAQNAMKYNLAEACNSTDEDNRVDEERLIELVNNGDIYIDETMAWSNYDDIYDAQIVVIE